jgi:hypothetical protein
MGKAPEAFSFERYEGERRAAQPLAERAKRTEAAERAVGDPAVTPDLEQTIQGSVVGIGLGGAAQR